MTAAATAALDHVRTSFDVTPFLRVGNPKRSSWLAGDEGALVFFYANDQGRTFLIRTQAPWAIEQIQRWARTDVDGQFGDLTRRAIIAKLREGGTQVPDTEPATNRLLGSALVGALFGGRGTVLWPDRMEWPDTHRAARASGHSTYFGAFDIALGRAVPVEGITTEPPPAAPVVPPTVTTAPTAPAPTSPATPAAPVMPAPVMPATQPSATTMPGGTQNNMVEPTRSPGAVVPGSPAPAPGAVPEVYPPGQQPSTAAPPGYAYVPATTGQTVLMPVLQVLNLLPGQVPPPAPAGHQWSLSITGSVVLIPFAQSGAAPQGGCPADFVKSDAGCKPTNAAAVPMYGRPLPPLDLTPKSMLASKDPALTDAERLKAKLLEVELFAFPEAQRVEGSASSGSNTLITLAALGGMGAAAGVGGYFGGRAVAGARQ